MLALVTGVAGFVGSHIADELLAGGNTVLGVDCVSDYYDVRQKRENLSGLLPQRNFHFVEDDLVTCPVEPLLEGVDVVFHQAAQPGVRDSWSNGFSTYLSNNVAVTQRLLEGVRGTRLTRFVYASSSSIYGNAARYPTRETDVPNPHSPYGVTKLAGEQLVSLYGRNFAVPTVSLRYHTVYGPRQRPDMATHRLVEAALTGGRFPLFGAGSHVRDFTFVDDVVRANLAAWRNDVEKGAVLNVAGGGATSMLDLVREVEALVGAPIALDHRPEQPGDVAVTGGSCDLILKVLGWAPKVSLQEGLSRQVAWHRNPYEERAALPTGA